MAMSLRKFSPCGGASCRRGFSGRASAGFTLVEISMVLLLFASAVGGLLSFFPVGLRLENNAISDSAQTMFALNVLGQVEANAANITDWDVWNDTDDFISAVFNGGSGGKKRLAAVKVDGKTLSPTFKKRSSRGDGSQWEKNKDWAEEDIYGTDWDGTPVEHYLTSRGAVRYVIQVSPVETPIYFGTNDNGGKKRPPLGYGMRRVVIWVTDRRDGDPFLNTPFTLDLFYAPPIDEILEGGA